MNLIPKPIRNLFGSRANGAESNPAATGDAGAASSPLGGEADCTEVSLQHLWSDESNALKLQIDRNLLPFGEKREYRTAEEAEDSPLVRAILEAGGIESVTIESVYITVRMAPDADWDDLLQRVPAMIRKFFAAGGVPFANAPSEGGKKRYTFGFRQVATRSREEQIRVVQELFDKEVNPAVASHGGYFNLLDVKDNTVYVELGGGCQGCGMANVTLRQGVEARLREVMPEMVALVDSTDHAAGTNPYYQQSKK